MFRLLFQRAGFNLEKPRLNTAIGRKHVPGPEKPAGTFNVIKGRPSCLGSSRNEIAFLPNGENIRSL